MHDDDLACAELVEMATEYLEGALPADRARLLERHVATCPGCTEYVAQMRAIAGSLGGLGGDSLSPEARERLIAAFSRPRP